VALTEPGADVRHRPNDEHESSRVRLSVLLNGNLEIVRGLDVVEIVA
jgi:hypothetical protein